MQVDRTTRNNSVKLTKVRLTDDDKKKLANLVKERPCLWQLSHKDHRKFDACTAAWNDVSKELGFAVPLCKSAWKSLRDSLRYFGAPTKCKGKSGDAAEDLDEFDDQCESFDEEKLSLWKFWDDLKFLIEAKPKRKTISSLAKDIESVADGSASNDIVIESLTGDVILESFQNGDCKNENTGDPLDTDEVSDLSSTAGSKRSKSNYDFHTKKKRVSSDKSADERIADSIQSLVNLRKVSVTETVHPVVKPEDTLTCYSMFLNMDRMLKKLPEETIEELNFQFISLIREELKKLNANTNK